MILNKTMEELKEAIDSSLTVVVWGTAANVFAIVQNRDTEEHQLEMWKVIP